MIKRSRREYLRLLDASKIAAESAIDIFNSVWHPYRNQATLMLLANSWELLSKAVLVHEKESILRARSGDTISAQEAVFRLQSLKILDKNQAETIQQIISLRHAATHLPMKNLDIRLEEVFSITPFITPQWKLTSHTPNIL